VSPETLLHIDALLAGYDRPVGRPLSLTLARGEIVGLWGANGAGKSTLLKALVGEASIHAGSFTLAVARRVAYLAQRQTRPLEVPLTGSEMLRFLGVDRSTPPAGLVEYLPRRIDTLSGGQYQLLSLWATLAGEADVVLLDEPTNHLDPGHLVLAAEEILLRRTAIGCLVVSHDRDFLNRLGARIVDVDGGSTHG